MNDFHFSFSNAKFSQAILSLLLWHWHLGREKFSSYSKNGFVMQIESLQYDALG